MTLEEARTAARMLDDAYQITLREVHHWYPAGGGRSTVAATVVRQLQEVMARKGWPHSHFLGVNGILMNPDHRPGDEFEKQAVQAIKDGQDRVESVENGQFRVATAVSLGFGCSSCHWAAGSRTPRAAITWNIPVKPGAATAATGKTQARR